MTNTNGLIFVQVASYRDPQLVPTISDMLAKADDPAALSFGVCWQHGPEENLGSLDFVELPPYSAKLRAVKVPFSESKGLCWARSVTNSLYGGEELTMQIDSHHRFAPHWDSLMMEDYDACRRLSPKPILTTYLPPFDPNAHDANPEKTSRAPTLMSQYRFHAGSKLLGSMPWYIPQKRRDAMGAVVRARTMSGHFYLVDGGFCSEVPYDPGLYFGGEIEEVSMTLRAWTHGYDLFSPTRESIAWHEYTRKDRPKHWDDHANWTQLERKSCSRFDTLCGRRSDHDDLRPGAPFGLGTARSLADYCEFAGIDFGGCRIQQDTLDVEDPPNDPSGVWVSFCEESKKTDEKAVRRKYVARWSLDTIKLDVARKGGVAPKLLALGLEDDAGRSIIRSDVFSNCATTSSKEIEYDGPETPARFVLWPMFQDGTWGSRQDGPLAPPAFGPPPPYVGAVAPARQRVEVRATVERRSTADDDDCQLTQSDMDILVQLACDNAKGLDEGGVKLAGFLKDLKTNGMNDISIEYVHKSVYE